MTGRDRDRRLRRYADRRTGRTLLRDATTPLHPQSSSLKGIAVSRAFARTGPGFRKCLQHPPGAYRSAVHLIEPVLDVDPHLDLGLGAQYNAIRQ
jgi:hypothetical protein